MYVASIFLHGNMSDFIFSYLEGNGDDCFMLNIFRIKFFVFLSFSPEKFELITIRLVCLMYAFNNKCSLSVVVKPLISGQ